MNKSDPNDDKGEGVKESENFADIINRCSHSFSKLVDPTNQLTRAALEALAAVDAEEVGLVAGGGVHRQQVLFQRLLALEFLGEIHILIIHHQLVKILI